MAIHRRQTPANRVERLTQGMPRRAELLVERRTSHFERNVPPVGLVIIGKQYFQIGAPETGRNSLLSAEAARHALRRGPRRFRGLHFPGARTNRTSTTRTSSATRRVPRAAHPRGTRSRDGGSPVRPATDQRTGRRTATPARDGGQWCARADAGQRGYEPRPGCAPHVTTIYTPCHPTRPSGKPTGSRRTRPAPRAFCARDTPVRRATFTRHSRWIFWRTQPHPFARDIERSRARKRRLRPLFRRTISDSQQGH